MQCAEVADLLLDDERERSAALEQHLAACGVCAHVARGLRRLDSVLASSLVVEPPAALQQQLANLALAAARPPSRPWWTQLGEVLRWLNPAVGLVRAPQMVAAQGLVAVLLALASWQIFGWVTTVQPVVGDVAYAVELVMASPASVYLGGLQIDLQNLGVWLIVGMCGWLISEDGLIGRRFSTRLRLP